MGNCGCPGPEKNNEYEMLSKLVKRKIITSEKDFLEFNELICQTMVHLKRYNFQKVIGEGQSGIIYEVEEIGGEIKRACKINKINNGKTLNFEFLNRLEHPKITKIFEISEKNEKLYQVMEFFEHGDLYEEIVKNGCFTEEHALFIIFQIISGIYYLNINNLVHFDLKPEHIMIDSFDISGKLKVKIADFETSILIENDDKLKIIHNSYYVAPEILEKNKFTEKADMWSVGVIFYLLLTGETPFYDENENELKKKIINSNINLTRKNPILKNISNESFEILCKMLDRSPETRISSVQALNHSIFKKFSTNNEDTVEDFSKSSVFLKNLRSYKSDYRIDQAILYLVIHHLEYNDQLKVYENLFRLTDIDGNSYLSREDLVKGFSRMNSSLSKETLHNLFNKNSTISYEDFIKNFISYDELFNENNLRKTFEYFDINQIGEISIDELKEVVCSGEYSEESLQRLNQSIYEVDLNKDNYISFGEFKKLIRSSIKNL